MAKFDPFAVAVKVRQGTLKLKDVPEKRRADVRTALSHSGRLAQYKRDTSPRRFLVATPVVVRRVKAH